MACSVYLVVTLYVRGDRVLLRALRLLESLGGRIIGVDEVNRRVVCVTPSKSIDGLSSLLSDYASGYVVNVKASCNVESLSELEGRIKGFKSRVRGGSNVYYLAFNGRVVEVNFRGGGRVDFKIGVRSSLVKPVPPSVFNMTVEEARSAVSDLESLLSQLGLEVKLSG
mgnify:CR=1 FL=1